MGSDLLGDIPTILADVFEQGAIQWRAAVNSGTWADLTGARLCNRRASLAFDERREREHEMAEADLIVPTTSSALLTDYEIKEADGTTWVVRDPRGDSDTGAVVYTVRRDPSRRYGPDKGHTA